MAYFIAVIFGNIAFFLCSGKRLFFNHHRLCYDWPDPDDAPIILAFLMTPLPGLVAVVDFFMWVRERMRNPGEKVWPTL